MQIIHEMDGERENKWFKMNKAEHPVDYMCVNVRRILTAV